MRDRMGQWCVFLAVLLAGCGKVDEATQIGKQMELYAKYTKTMNHFGVASLYAEDGVNEANVKGPKAIQQHLSATASLKVEEFAVDAAKPVITGDRAEQTYVFQKQVRTPLGSTVQLTGRMKVIWVRSASGRWLIQSMSAAESK